MKDTVEEMGSKLKNSEVMEWCDNPSVRLANALRKRNIRTIYELTKIKDEEDFCGGVVGNSSDGWAFKELKDLLESMNLSFGMTDKKWEEWAKKNTKEIPETEESDNQCNKIELLKKLFLFLIENCKSRYRFDGNMHEIKYDRLSLSFEGDGENTKFILKSAGHKVFAGELKNYYIDQCRGGGSPFLFRNIEGENKGISVQFYHTKRFYDEYEDKELGAKLKSLAKDYYDVWKDSDTSVRNWNSSQFD